MPIRLWVEPTNFCNLKCTMCPNKTMPVKNKGYMKFELFKKIIDETKDHIYDINIHHRGEALLHPELPKMIEYAKKSGIKVKLHTNATQITKDKGLQLLNSGLDLISFSFEGFEKRKYEQTRKGAKFEITFNNILEFLKLKKEMGKYVPYTIIEVISHSKSSDSEKLKEFKQRFGHFPPDEIIIKELHNWAGQLSTKILPKNRTYNRCTFPWYAAIICWDGTITPCPQDFSAVNNMGNISNQTLKEIWNGDRYRRLRKKLISGSLRDLKSCGKCDRLFRKKVGGIPYQYALSFLNDQLIGFGRLRKILGSYERN